MSAADRLHELFADAFDGSPDVVASAPGRVNLIGEHTDYNGGEVLPIAIEQRTWVGLRLARGNTGRAVSDLDPAPRVLRFDQETREGAWTDYVVGVARALKAATGDFPPVDLAVASDVPAGSGLSSSAALEVATAAALLELVGRSLPPQEIALAGNTAENEFVGVRSGVMDQFVSAMARGGHALHLYCDTLRTAHVPFEDHVLIFETGVPRSLRASAFNRRREECDAALDLLRQADPTLPNLAAATPDQVRAADLPAPLDRRALHVVTETRRVGDLVAALRTGQGTRDDLLLASHESLRTLYECSSPELDWFVEEAMGTAEIEGARLTGAGWGGCAIAVGPRSALERLASSIVSRYHDVFALEPRVWITRASPGVTLGNSTYSA